MPVVMGAAPFPTYPNCCGQSPASPSPLPTLSRAGKGHLLHRKGEGQTELESTKVNQSLDQETILPGRGRAVLPPAAETPVCFEGLLPSLLRGLQAALKPFEANPKCELLDTSLQEKDSLCLFKVQGRSGMPGAFR